MKNLYVAPAVALKEDGDAVLLSIAVFSESEQDARNAVERAALNNEDYAAAEKRGIGLVMLIPRERIKEELSLEDASPNKG